MHNDSAVKEMQLCAIPLLCQQVRLYGLQENEFAKNQLQNPFQLHVPFIETY